MQSRVWRDASSVRVRRAVMLVVHAQIAALYLQGRVVDAELVVEVMHEGIDEGIVVVVVGADQMRGHRDLARAQRARLCLHAIGAQHVGGGGGEFGFAFEAGAEVLVAREFGGEHFEGIAARQHGVSCSVDGAHAPGTENVLDDVAADV